MFSNRWNKIPDFPRRDKDMERAELTKRENPIVRLVGRRGRKIRRNNGKAEMRITHLQSIDCRQRVFRLFERYLDQQERGAMPGDSFRKNPQRFGSDRRKIGSIFSNGRRPAKRFFVNDENTRLSHRGALVGFVRWILYPETPYLPPTS